MIKKEERKKAVEEYRSNVGLIMAKATSLALFVVLLTLGVIFVILKIVKG